MSKYSIPSELTVGRGTPIEDENGRTIGEVPAVTTLRPIAVVGGRYLVTGLNGKPGYVDQAKITPLPPSPIFAAVADAMYSDEHTTAARALMSGSDWEAPQRPDVTGLSPLQRELVSSFVEHSDPRRAAQLADGLRRRNVEHAVTRSNDLDKWRREQAEHRAFSSQKRDGE